MKRFLFFLLLLKISATSSQTNYTVIYKHYYGVEAPSSEGYNFLSNGALFVLGDTLSIYRLSKDRKQLHDKIILNDKTMHHGVMRYVSDSFRYDVVQTDSVGFFIKSKDEHIAWHDLNKEETILGFPCKAVRGKGIEIWYTTAKTHNAGPLGYAGLPGLILKLYDHRYNMYIEAVEILPEIPAISYAHNMATYTNEQYWEKFVVPRLQEQARARGDTSFKSFYPRGNFYRK